jgi:hypothetical protein
MSAIACFRQLTKEPVNGTQEKPLRHRAAILQKVRES